MLRKYIKKYLPSYESIQQSRFVGLFGELLRHHNLWYVHRRSVAGGVAVGFFAGLIPGSNPVQFFFAALFARTFKVNLPVAVFTTLYSNPFTIVPIYIAAYSIGEIVLGGGNGAMPMADLNLMNKSISEWVPAMVDWVISLGKPVLAGLLLLALILPITSYIAVRGAWRVYMIYEWRTRTRRRHRE